MGKRSVRARFSGSSSAVGSGSDSGHCLELFTGEIKEAPSSNHGSKRKASSDFSVSSSRSSIKQLYDVISRFGEDKKCLVRSIGFGGLLHFPPLRQINRRFAVWLMSRVDHLTQTIVIDECRRIRFNKSDVELVFGIPSQGRNVSELGAPTKEALTQVMCSYLGIGHKDNRSIKAAQEVIERNYSGEMTKSDENAFKVAFVVYVMSTLLAPGAKHDYASVDYWNALLVPSEISKFDWSDFVVKRLFDAVLKVKHELGSTNKVANITGCSMFLQVLYLDSIDLGVLNMKHTIVPRIRHFTPDIMKSMILADTVSVPEDAILSEYGKCKLRAPADVCYSWASSSDVSLNVTLQPDPLGSWDFAFSFTRLIGASVEAVGPLTIALTGFDDVMHRMISGAATRMIAVITSVAEPFTVGFSYKACHATCQNTSGHHLKLLRTGISVHSGESMCPACPSVVSCQFCDSPVDVTSYCEDKNLCSINSVCTSSHFVMASCHPVLGCFYSVAHQDSVQKLYPSLIVREDVDSSIALFKQRLVIRVMARYYLSFRCTRATCIRYNVFGSSNGNGKYVLLNRNQPSLMIDSLPPWKLGARRGIKDIEMDIPVGQSSKIDAIHSDHRPIILHYTPRVIVVSNASFKLQFLGKSEVTMDMFDAIIRRFRQRDDMLYKGKQCARWRHFFETEVLVSILAGFFDPSDHVFSQHFVNNSVNNDISVCKMLFFPGLFKHRWVCYAWNVDANNIAVFDPSLLLEQSDEYDEVHLHVVQLLKKSMAAVSAKFFSDWNIDWTAATMSVIRLSVGQPIGLNCSGVACANFCYSFDGYARSIQDINIRSRTDAEIIFFDAIKLQMNHGFVPNDLLYIE